MPRKFDDARKKEWLELYEQGKTEKWIAHRSKCDVRTVKKAINDADAGVRATIFNDGSSANPYRLVLSANQTGAANSISITASLTGGNNLDFVTSSFDSPETIGMDAGSTSQVTLGAAASYTGSQNKIYTFSVAGSGSQTVGTDTITINWTDGTDSGSFDVTAVDTEVALTGTGSDGLTLSFAAGTLTAGEHTTLGQVGNQWSTDYTSTTSIH